MSTPPLRTKIRRRVRAALLTLLVSTLGLLPLRFCRSLGRGLGRLAHVLARKERTRALSNLRLAFPEKSEKEREALALSCFVGLGENLLELCAVRRRPELMGELVRCPPEDIGPLEEALASGKGCIVLSGHIGSWELAARAVACRGHEVVAVARRFHDPGLGALVEGFRESGGVVTLPRGAPGTVKRLLGQIRKGGAIFMLVDQDTSVPSVFVPFFGQPAKTPRGQADLSLRTGAELVVGFIHRESPGGSHRMRAERLALPEPTGDRERDVLAMVGAINARIEEEIRAHPADWVWFHERWRSSPVESPPRAEGRAS